jgi:hypothetical protein
MKKLMCVAVGTAMALAVSSVARAQSKTITGEMTTITATVEAIDHATRTLTVKSAKGDYVPIVVPESMKRFSEIKVGDTISARYYDNVVVRLKAPGEPAVDTAAKAVTPAAAGNLAGTGAKQRTITATIVAIDRDVPSITFKGENVKWNYSSRVADKQVLAKVKVGDRVDITWTEAVLVSVVPPPKK